MIWNDVKKIRQSCGENDKRRRGMGRMRFWLLCREPGNASFLKQGIWRSKEVLEIWEEFGGDA